MKKISFVLSLTLLLVSFITPNWASSSANSLSAGREVLANRIIGQVWGPDNRPVADIYVELNNEVGMTIGQRKTTSSGMYEFTNLSAGLFRVKILVLGTDYLEQVKDVQIINVVQGMSDNQYCDFHLKYDPRRVTPAGSGGPPEQVFMQEGVTPEAKKLYEKGRDLLMDKKSDEAIAKFKEALAILPDYYYANSALGGELVERGKYREALDYLIRAIDVNQRGFRSYYALAYACFQLKEMPEAKTAAQAATILSPSSFDAQLLLGMILRQTGSFADAEKALVKAKTIANNKAPRVNWQLALVYNRLNRNDEAIAELETYVKNETDSQSKAEANELIAKLRTSMGAKPK